MSKPIGVVHFKHQRRCLITKVVTRAICACVALRAQKVGLLSRLLFGQITDKYRKNNPYFGCIVGRVANRIAGGKFSLEGEDFTLAQNNGNNSLHGGLKGFDKRAWIGFTDSEDSVTFSYVSEDGEEGYPGEQSIY